MLECSGVLQFFIPVVVAISQRSSRCNYRNNISVSNILPGILFTGERDEARVNRNAF